MEGQPGGAGVHVGLVHGEEVDVVEDGAGVVEILHRLSKANIQQHSPEPLLLKSSFTIQQRSGPFTVVCDNKHFLAFGKTFSVHVLVGKMVKTHFYFVEHF